MLKTLMPTKGIRVHIPFTFAAIAKWLAESGADLCFGHARVVVPESRRAIVDQCYGAEEKDEEEEYVPQLGQPFSHEGVITCLTSVHS